MLNREQRRLIKNLKRDKLDVWVNEYGMAMYADGMRDSFLSLLLKLHDEFGFGNERIKRLLELSDTWLQGIHEKDSGIDADGIKQQLIAEGITCLLDTNL